MACCLAEFGFWLVCQTRMADPLRSACAADALWVLMQVIMATNRADTLDPALLRPGRLDRKIEFPMPDRRQKRLVFQVCSGRTRC